MITGFCARNPRTSAGISEDGTKLYLAVVDGRSTTSVGMSLNELGTLMEGLGAYRALNLDGGGSSTMVISSEGGVQNRPSDGAQRVVGNHLGVCIVEPYGTLRVVVRRADAAAPDGGEAAGVAGVPSTLSVGAVGMTDENGAYEFVEVPRGEVTIRSTLPSTPPRSSPCT